VFIVDKDNAPEAKGPSADARQRAPRGAEPEPSRPVQHPRKAGWDASGAAPRRDRPGRIRSSTHAATGRGPAADSGRLLCGKQADGPTDGHILCPRSVRPSGAHPAGLASDHLAGPRNPPQTPSLPCGVCFAGCFEAAQLIPERARSPSSLRILWVDRVFRPMAVSERRASAT